MLNIPGLDQELPPSEFPAKYLQAHEWGFSVEQATELFNRFGQWLYCDRIIQKSGLIQKRKGVNFAADPGHSQVRGTYDEQLQTVEDDHCDGPVLPLREAPQIILDLQKKLTAHLQTMPGYEKRVVNFISAVYYADQTVGIDWHKHSEDDGIDSPVLILSTGDPRPFHLGLQRRMPMVNGKRQSPEPLPHQHWPRMAEHGSLIVVPASFNDTHWHAILPEKYVCGPRISFVTKCLVRPRVFSIKEKHPKFAVYVGREYANWPETPYGNRAGIPDTDPPELKTAKFRVYAKAKLKDPAFRAQAIKDLKGKHLLCWCIQEGPKRAPWCHARIWLKIIAETEAFEKL
jgi:hypothetical protein